MSDNNQGNKKVENNNQANSEQNVENTHVTASSGSSTSVQEPKTIAPSKGDSATQVFGKDHVCEVPDKK